jgi:hypothetical protein
MRRRASPRLYAFFMAHAHLYAPFFRRFFYSFDSQVPFGFGGCMDAVFIGLSVALVALLIGLVKVCDVLGDRS